MSTFLDKLKGKIEEEVVKTHEDPTKPAEEHKEKQQTGYIQLDVDIYQTSSRIVVFALVPGVDISDLDITIENENDVITIQGKRTAPEIENPEEEKKYLRQELQWGHFYRQIILPQEIDVSKVEAKIKKGILIIRMPVLRLHTKGKKRIEVKMDM